MHGQLANNAPVRLLLNAIRTPVERDQFLQVYTATLDSLERLGGYSGQKYREKKNFTAALLHGAKLVGALTIQLSRLKERAINDNRFERASSLRQTEKDLGALEKKLLGVAQSEELALSPDLKDLITSTTKALPTREQLSKWIPPKELVASFSTVSFHNMPLTEATITRPIHKPRTAVLEQN